jgi:hypothetical protein
MGIAVPVLWQALDLLHTTLSGYYDVPIILAATFQSISGSMADAG